MPAFSASSDKNGSWHWTRLNAWFIAPADVASLAAFRIMFGLLMTTAMVRFMAKGWVNELYIQPSFHFAYPGFEWIRPWPGAFMYLHFVLLALLGLGIAAGFFYRICTVLFFLGFTYVELLDQTAYLNHYYLISLLSGLLIFLPANRTWSLDVWRKPQLHVDVVPAWCLNILRFQVAVVYIFAGLAKFNADWLLRAEPLRIWLAARSDLPLLGHWLAQPWAAFAASWFGALFDTTIVFFLLSRRTRKPAYLVVIGFHIATWLLFNIGMFPWIMIIAATILFPPDWPRYWMARLLKYPLSLTPRFSGVNSVRSERETVSTVFCLPTAFNPIRRPLPLFLCAYVIIQLALPLRPYFSSQPSAWTCSSFNCAWQVMIAEKSGYVEFFAFDPATGERRKLSVRNYITPRQEIMMAQDPYLIREMARRFETDIAASGSTTVQIQTEAFATLNGRPSQRLIDPRASLTARSAHGWILPLAR
jgi:hypothetical protein